MTSYGTPASERPKAVNILGIRGVPAVHGGFETFGERLAIHLRDRGWDVNVYCQRDPDRTGAPPADEEDDWEGIHRIHLGSRAQSSLGSMIFDARCARDVRRRPGIELVLGYNTAIFSVPLRLFGRKVIMNMDGIEWKRAKWSLPIKVWFYVNEFIGANFCTQPIADHPEIARHLRRHGCTRATVIPYGADSIDTAPSAPLAAYGVEPDRYLVSIARIEPENSILEMVEAFSRTPRAFKLLVLGKLDPDNAYHRAVRAAASADVAFPGAIYEKTVVQALRFHARAYLHGHQVGGTNPSLVEALGAGNAVIAHDNPFNRWVAGPDQLYFSDPQSLDRAIGTALMGGAPLSAARAGARARHAEAFRWEDILAQYERLLETYL